MCGSALLELLWNLLEQGEEGRQGEILSFHRGDLEIIISGQDGNNGREKKNKNEKPEEKTYLYAWKRTRLSR